MTDKTTFIEGRSAEKARELLDLAEKAGYEPGVVRTTSDGYLVPADLVTGGNDEDNGSGRLALEDGGDPADFTLAEVQEYLGGDISEEERERVLQAERDGKARKGLVGESEEQN